MSKKKIVVLTGAGISAESGLRTFRDAGGLWEGYNVMDVATPEAWEKNPELVLRFYNERRASAASAEPNAGHFALAELEKHFDVLIVTQNVDNLHEKAGSSNIIHLHGELSKVRSTKYPELIYEIGGKAIEIGDNCEKGAQLRPHIVWFGEDVPLIYEAGKLAETADVFLVVGTSMVVYPAAGLIDYVPRHAPKYIIDPNKPSVPSVGRYPNITFVTENATTGVPKVAQELVGKLQAGEL
jgi:NAD-dependent deacetylase